MRLLHLALKYDYGLRDRGLSFEHHNFYNARVNIERDILCLDIGEIHALKILRVLQFGSRSRNLGESSLHLTR